MGASASSSKRPVFDEREDGECAPGCSGARPAPGCSALPRPGVQPRGTQPSPDVQLRNTLPCPVRGVQSRGTQPCPAPGCPAPRCLSRVPSRPCPAQGSRALPPRRTQGFSPRTPPDTPGCPPDTGFKRGGLGRGQRGDSPAAKFQSVHGQRSSDRGRAESRTSAAVRAESCSGVFPKILVGFFGFLFYKYTVKHHGCIRNLGCGLRFQRNDGRTLPGWGRVGRALGQHTGTGWPGQP